MGNVSVDEVTGELIVGEQIMEFIDKQEKQFSETEDNEFDLMSGYKKCYQGRKKTIAKKWSKLETELFYKALTAVGQDFQMMELYFKSFGGGKTRNKKELRSKFQREDKSNGKKITQALKNSIKSELKISDFE